MSQSLIGIILIIGGSALLLLSDKFAHYHASFQNKNFNLHLSNKDIKNTRTLSILVGFIFIVYGVLTLLGKTQWNV
jgi:hypothetical protein